MISMTGQKNYYFNCAILKKVNNLISIKKDDYGKIVWFISCTFLHRFVRRLFIVLFIF